MLEERIKPKEYGIEKDKELIDKWHEPTINPEAQDIKELEEDMMRIVISLYNPFTPGFRNRSCVISFIFFYFLLFPFSLPSLIIIILTHSSIVRQRT